MRWAKVSKEGASGVGTGRFWLDGCAFAGSGVEATDFRGCPHIIFDINELILVQMLLDARSGVESHLSPMCVYACLSHVYMTAK